MTQDTNNFAQLKIKAIPNAKNTELAGRHGDFIKIKISAVPDKGKANKELVTFLSKQFGITKKDIQIIRGHKNHRKILLIPKNKLEIINKAI